MTAPSGREMAVYNGRPCEIAGEWGGYVTVRVVGEDFLRCVLEGDRLERKGREGAKNGQ